MRRFLSLMCLPALCLAGLSLPARAADPAKPDAPGAAIPDAQAAKPDAPPAQPTKPDATPAHHARQTWEQHFSTANQAHDGHLTAAEAKEGYPEIAKHFDDIDADHKGYVTVGDIRAWRVMRKAARRLAKPPEDKLRPRSAVQHVFPDFNNAPAARTQTKT